MVFHEEAACSDPSRRRTPKRKRAWLTPRPTARDGLRRQASVHRERGDYDYFCPNHKFSLASRAPKPRSPSRASSGVPVAAPLPVDLEASGCCGPLDGRCTVNSLSIADAQKLGVMIRELRQAAGLTRMELQAQTQVSVVTIKNCEMCRRPITEWALRRLLAHPSMRDLPAMAAAEGIKLSLEGDADKKPDA